MQNCVFVKDNDGQALMPCSPRTARVLLRDKKANVISKTPFTIQLNHATSHYTQEIHVGIDTGQKHIGLAVRCDTIVLFQARVDLRQDVSEKITLRAVLRRGRRNGKTRYRKARCLNRVGKFKKTEFWYPPSVQAKINHNIVWIERLINALPATKQIVRIEVGKFDPAKLRDPEISGVGYQQGALYGYENRRMYVFSRDNYICQVCHRAYDKTTKQPLKLHVHHIRFRSNGGSDHVENLLTVCTDCHTRQNHQQGGVLHDLQEKHVQAKRLNLAAATQMNAIKSAIIRKYEIDPRVTFTFGYVTNCDRKALGLDKSHANDAIAITQPEFIDNMPTTVALFRQYRKKKRSLHNANAVKGRKEPNCTQTRHSRNTPYVTLKKSGKTFYLGDRVDVAGEVGYITGFTGNNGYITNQHGKLVQELNGNGNPNIRLSLANRKTVIHTNGWLCFTQKQS